MTSKHARRTSLVLPRGILTTLGLASMIIGILAMYVWMSGHGSTSQHLAWTTTASSTGEARGLVVPAGQAHDSHDHAVAPVLDAVTAGVADPVNHGVTTGCGVDCTDEMALGMCALAIIVVGIGALLILATRCSVSIRIPRGPPIVHRISRPAPASSLTQLCISRT